MLDLLNCVGPLESQHVCSISHIHRVRPLKSFSISEIVFDVLNRARYRSPASCSVGMAATSPPEKHKARARLCFVMRRQEFLLHSATSDDVDLLDPTTRLNLCNPATYSSTPLPRSWQHPIASQLHYACAATHCVQQPMMIHRVALVQRAIVCSSDMTLLTAFRFCNPDFNKQNCSWPMTRDPWVGPKGPQKYHGSGRVGSGRVGSGRFESGQEAFETSRVGSGSG